MERGFFGLDLLYQAGNPVLRELVGDIGRYALVVFDLVVEFGASLAHGSPLHSGGSTTLSVAGRGQGRDGDGRQPRSIKLGSRHNGSNLEAAG